MVLPVHSSPFPHRPAGWLAAAGVVFIGGGLLPLLRLEGLLLLFLAAAGCVALIWYFPLVWVALLVALPFSVEFDALAGGHNLTLPTEALIPALVLAHAMACLRRGRISYLRSPLNWPVTALAGVVLLSLLVSGDRTVTAKAIVRDGGYLLAGYYLTTRVVRSRQTLLVLLWGLVLSTTAVALYGLGTQVLDGFSIYGNIAGPFYENHCIYAAHLAIILAGLFAVLVALPGGGVWRLVAWGAFLVLFVAVGLSFVRGAWLSLAVAFGFVAIACLRRLRPGVVFWGGVAAFGMASVVTTHGVVELLAARLDDAFNPMYVTNFDRIDRWMAALGMWADHPLLGVGWGRYPDEYRNYTYFLHAYSTDLHMGAHNLYLEILAETGLAGLGCFLWLLATTLLQAWRLWRRLYNPFYRSIALVVAAGLLTLVVHLTVNNLGPSDKISILFWLLPGLLPVLARLDRASMRSEDRIA